MNSTCPSTISSGSEEGRRRREILAFTAVERRRGEGEHTCPDTLKNGFPLGCTAVKCREKALT